MQRQLLLATVVALLPVGGLVHAALRADWSPDSEPLGISYGVDGVWDDLSGALGDQWTPNPIPDVVSKPTPPPGVATVSTGAGQAIALKGTNGFEGATFAGGAIFSPAIDAGDATIQILLAPDDLLGGRQVIFECGGDAHGLSLVLIDNLLTFTVSQTNGTAIILQSTVDLTGVWVHSSSFLRVTACLDQHPATGERAAIQIEATNGTNRVSAGALTSDANFTSWCGPGLSGLGLQSGEIGGDLAGAVTNLSGGGPLAGFKGFLGRLRVYDHAFCASPLSPTVTGGDKYWWSAGLGWINVGEEADTVNGLAIGEMFCTGWAWSASAGWIDFGDGSPANEIRYGNTDGSDFGVNTIDGMLVGYAWAPSFGWINFGVDYPAGPDADPPRVDLITGQTRGYAWSASLGWINLGEGFAGAQTTSFVFFDTDEDGISDAWERNRLAAAGLANDLSLVGGGDSDGDLRSDEDEFNEDTDPFDAADRFKIIDLFPDTPLVGMTTVDFTSKPSRLYQVELGEDLINWTPHGAETVGESSGTSSAATPLDPALKLREFVRVGARRPLTP